MRINSVPDVKCFVITEMCYVHNQWYDISCPTLYISGVLHIISLSIGMPTYFEAVRCDAHRWPEVTVLSCNFLPTAFDMFLEYIIVWCRSYKFHKEAY